MTNEHTLRHQLRIAQQTAMDAHTQFSKYTVDRGIYSEHFVGSYLTDLPKLEGVSFLDQFKEATTTGQKLALLDVGCGNGNFLMEMRQMFGNAHTLHGLSLFAYHDLDLAEAYDFQVQLKPIEQFHARNQYDVIVAEQSLNYSYNPLIALKRVYAALKPEGMAFLAPVSLQFATQSDQDTCFEFLRNNYGMQITPSTKGLVHPSWGLAFRKTLPSLKIPVQIAKLVEAGNEYHQVTQAQYQFRTH